jgi:hypothetical protein
MALWFSGLDSAPISPYNHIALKIAATGPEKKGHARPVNANILLAPFTKERGQNAQDEDQKRCEKTLSPHRQW